MSHTQPTQPYGTLPPQPLPPNPAMLPPKKTKRFGWLALILTGVICLGVGGAVGATDDPAAVAPGPQPTVTATKTLTVGEGGQEVEPTTTEPTKAAPAKYDPKPKDFRVGLKITDKDCFGSAGCNLTYKMKLDYLGTQKLPADGITEITYEITGAEDPITGTLELDGKGMFDVEENFTSTSSSSKKLAAKVTQVEYNEFG